MFNQPQVSSLTPIVHSSVSMPIHHGSLLNCAYQTFVRLFRLPANLLGSLTYHSSESCHARVPSRCRVSSDVSHHKTIFALSSWQTVANTSSWHRSYSCEAPSRQLPILSSRLSSTLSQFSFIKLQCKPLLYSFSDSLSRLSISSHFKPNKASRSYTFLSFVVIVPLSDICQSSTQHPASSTV